MGSSCMSVQRGVIVIGVLSGVVSTILSVGIVAMFVTLEDHMQACRTDHTKAADILQLLPACSVLTDASFVLSSRVFVLVQVALWLLLLIFSILLVVGGIKERGGLLVPWVVLTLVVMGSIVYDAVQAGVRGNITSLLISITALVAATLCLLVVQRFFKQLRNKEKAAEASASALLSTPMFDMHRHTPPLLFAGSPGPRYIRYGDIGDVALCHDSPPDYDTAAALTPFEPKKFISIRQARSENRNTPKPTHARLDRVRTRSESAQHTKMPTGLGVLR